MEGLTIWMADDSDDLCRSPRPDLTVKTLAQVESTCPQLPTPTLVSDAMIPKVLASEWRERIHGITDEAACGVGVKTQHEWDKQVMSIPERLEGLLTDFGVGSGIHE